MRVGRTLELGSELGIGIKGLGGKLNMDLSLIKKFFIAAVKEIKKRRKIDRKECEKKRSAKPGCLIRDLGANIHLSSAPNSLTSLFLISYL